MSTGDQVILRRFVMMMFLLLYLLSTLWAKKLQPFYFCNNFVKSHCILTIVGAQILKEICNKIAHLS